MHVQFSGIRVNKPRRSLFAIAEFKKAWIANALLVLPCIEFCWRMHLFELMRWKLFHDDEDESEEPRGDGVDGTLEGSDHDNDETTEYW